MPHVAAADRPQQPGKFDGSLVRIMLDEQTAESVTLGEVVIKPGASVPLHRHKVEEAFYVISGSGTALMGDEEVTVRAGDALLAPAGDLHGFRNDSSDDIRMVFFYPIERVWAEYPGGEAPTSYSFGR